VVRGAASARTALVVVRARRLRHRDAGGAAGIGAASDHVVRARVVRWAAAWARAAGHAHRARGVIAELDRSFDDAVAASRPAVRVQVEAGVRGLRAAAVAGAKRGDGDVHTPGRARSRADQVILRARIVVVALQRAAVGRARHRAQVALLALGRLDDAVPAARGTIGVVARIAAGGAAAVLCVQVTGRVLDQLAALRALVGVARQRPAQAAETAEPVRRSLRTLVRAVAVARLAALDDLVAAFGRAVAVGRVRGAGRAAPVAGDRQLDHEMAAGAGASRPDEEVDAARVVVVAVDRTRALRRRHDPDVARLAGLLEAVAADLVAVDVGRVRGAGGTAAVRLRPRLHDGRANAGG